MGQALYRKYRSKSLDDIVGQEHITKTLKQAIKAGRISHAYLFTGPKGVGKTSIARILAHAINNLPYNDGSTHVDIIEIDAATSGRIDEIRDLRERVYVSPTSAKYKVYIIDEVHMMTIDAFNALLKTLEEPPEHVVFILATTNPNKLPETIISRTQRFQFKPIEKSKAVSHLKHIADQEKIKITDEALDLIADHGQGSFRDSIGLLDQAANFASPVTADTINSLLGIPPADLIDRLTESIEDGNSSVVVGTLSELTEQGYPAVVVASKLSAVFRLKLIEGQSSLNKATLLRLLARLIEVSASPSPEHFLEICLIEAAPTPNLALTKVPKITQPLTTKATPQFVEEAAKLTIPKTKSAKTQPAKKSTKSLDETSWSEVLNLLRSKYNTLYGIVRMAKVDFSEPKIVQLQFAFPFHQKRINDPKNRQIIIESIQQVTGQDLAIDCVVNTELLKTAAPKKPIKDLETINAIFGDSEIID